LYIFHSQDLELLEQQVSKVGEDVIKAVLKTMDVGCHSMLLDLPSLNR
jgi:hypothetical protein